MHACLSIYLSFRFLLYASAAEKKSKENTQMRPWEEEHIFHNTFLLIDFSIAHSDGFSRIFPFYLDIFLYIFSFFVGAPIPLNFFRYRLLLLAAAAADAVLVVAAADDASATKFSICIINSCIQMFFLFE